MYVNLQWEVVSLFFISASAAHSTIPQYHSTNHQGFSGIVYWTLLWTFGEICKSDYFFSVIAPDKKWTNIGLGGWGWLQKIVALWFNTYQLVTAWEHHQQKWFFEDPKAVNHPLQSHYHLSSRGGFEPIKAKQLHDCKCIYVVILLWIHIKCQ